MKYVICRGCPGSGKTTWAKSFIEDRKHKPDEIWIRLNRDDLRRSRFNFKQWNEYKFSSKKENLINVLINDRIRYHAALKDNIIDDNTNLSRFEQVKKNAEYYGYEVEFKDFFDIALDKLIQRDLYREFSVGEDVVFNMFKKQLEIQGRVIKKDLSKPGCVIVDIDGTVADMGKGESWGRNPYDWSKVDQDQPRENVVNLVKLLIFSGENVVFLSGRDGVAYDKTYDWLEKHITKKPELYLRTAQDNRSDCIVKEEMLHNYVLHRYYIKYAIDDRKRVVDHYQALGLEVLQVDRGRF